MILHCHYQQPVSGPAYAQEVIVETRMCTLIPAYHSHSMQSSVVVYYRICFKAAGFTEPIYKINKQKKKPLVTHQLFLFTCVLHILLLE